MSFENTRGLTTSTQAQDVCVCEGVVTQVQSMRRLHVHRACLREVQQETFGMEDDDGAAVYCA